MGCGNTKAQQPTTKSGEAASQSNASAASALPTPHATATPARVEGLRLIIAGPPACGKGQHCSFLLKEYGVMHISTGDVMREEVKKCTEKGLKIKQFLEDGIDVDDDLLVSVVVSKLQDPAVVKQGWLLDGFPRSAAQAQKLTASGIQIDSFILLHVPDEELVDRVSNRRLDPETGAIYHLTKNPPPSDDTVKARLIQRADDTPEKIQERLDLFRKSVEAVRPFFGKISQIDGNLEGAAMESALKQCIPKIK